jgi:hypothetical protein
LSRTEKGIFSGNNKLIFTHNRAARATKGNPWNFFFNFYQTPDIIWLTIANS